MKAIKKGVVFLSFFIFLFTTLPVFAQTPITPTPTILAPTPCEPDATPESSNCVMVNQQELGFSIPSLSDVLTFAIRGFFILGGLAALVFLLLGAFSWITSGGEKERVHEAQQKIQAAILGLIMIVVVL